MSSFILLLLSLHSFIFRLCTISVFFLSFFIYFLAFYLSFFTFRFLYLSLFVWVSFFLPFVFPSFVFYRFFSFFLSICTFRCLIRFFIFRFYLPFFAPFSSFAHAVFSPADCRASLFILILCQHRFTFPSYKIFFNKQSRIILYPPRITS